MAKPMTTEELERAIQQSCQAEVDRHKAEAAERRRRPAPRGFVIRVEGRRS